MNFLLPFVYRQSSLFSQAFAFGSQNLNISKNLSLLLSIKIHNLRVNLSNNMAR